jgi:hypothetical protein
VTSWPLREYLGVPAGKIKCSGGPSGKKKIPLTRIVLIYSQIQVRYRPIHAPSPGIACYILR